MGCPRQQPKTQTPAMCHPTRIFNRHKDLERRRQLRKVVTREETILWAQIRKSQIENARFRRQYGVLNCVLDFYCPQLRLAIEIDGATHDGEENQAYDAVRQSEIEACNTVFLRFSNRQIYENLELVADTLSAKILEIRAV